MPKQPNKKEEMMTTNESPLFDFQCGKITRENFNLIKSKVPGIQLVGNKYEYGELKDVEEMHVVIHEHDKSSYQEKLVSHFETENTKIFLFHQQNRAGLWCLLQAKRKEKVYTKI